MMQLQSSLGVKTKVIPVKDGSFSTSTSRFLTSRARQIVGSPLQHHLQTPQLWICGIPVHSACAI